MWTPAQAKAINAHCADNLVSAAAGSGKTAVMVERIVSRVVSGKIDIDRILVVTFTNAAAAELKSRLMTKIMDALDSDNDADRLNKQLMLINNASICTIDSFCLNIIKNNFYKLDLDPAMKIADNAELELIKHEALNNVFEDYYNSEDKDFLNLVNCLTNKNDEALSDIINKIFKFTNSLPDGVDELIKLADKFCNNTWEGYLVEKAHSISASAVGYYDLALENLGFSDKTEKMRNQLIDEKNNYVLVLERNTWDDIRRVVLSFEFPTLSFPRGTTDEEKNPIKMPRENGKKLKTKLEDMFIQEKDIVIDDIKESSCMVNKLVEITLRYAKCFLDIKKEKGIVDFTDIEHFALKLLKNDNGGQTEVARQLMEKYDEIYVDEYQDCNLVQETLFSLISRGNVSKPNMFMVGDMKQSIYGFRGSEPSLFKNKADAYCDYSDKSDYNKIILNKNFRSRKSIIDGVNSIFSQIMSEKCGELKYTSEEYLYYNEGAYQEINDDLNSVDIVLLDGSGDYTDPNDGTELTEDIKGIEAEAIYVANRIKAMVNSDKSPYYVTDRTDAGKRKIRYSDIVILLRSGGEKAEIFDRILSLAQIPVYCDFGSGYFESPEVVFLINFLKIIDNPYDDVALLSVMRHPVIGFTDDEFVTVRLEKRQGYIYNSVKNYIKEFNNPLSDKLSHFVSLIKEYYNKSKYLSTDKLIWEIVKDTDYMAYLSFLSNSELRKANVNALMTRAYDFEKTSYRGIFDFIKYIDMLKHNNSDIEPAKTLSDDEDVVRIMTIHKSKGLEFPVVFLSNATKNFYDLDIKNEKILLDKDYGFGINFYDYANRYYYELPQKKMLKDVKYSKMLSEEMRVLYVALTRPKEKLIITGFNKNIRSRISKLSQMLTAENTLISPEIVSSARSFSDWILLAALRNNNLISEFSGSYYENKICDDAVFKLQIVDKNSVRLEINTEVQRQDISDFIKRTGVSENIKSILNYEYPFSELSVVSSNMSVSDIKRLEMPDDVYNYYNLTKLSVPKFYTGEQKLSAAQIGTLTHLVMEKLDFSKTDSIESIRSQIEDLVFKGYLTDKECKCVSSEKIHKIIHTDIGRKMVEFAHNIKREFGFKCLIDAKDIYKDMPSDEKIVVQGMIDAYFEDTDGQLILVDYKTDKITNGNDDIIKRYIPQLKYYKIALEKSLHKNVKETYLMLLDTGEAVRVKV